MDWTQFGLFFISVFGLFLWNRSESRNDVRHTDAKLESTRQLMQAIMQESKDFHGRMCTLEERYLQLISRKEKTDP